MSHSYANEESFNTYVDYLALKKHFSSTKYDYHKYNGRVRVSADKFKNRNDIFFFNKLSKKRDRHEILLSNVLEDSSRWIRDICEETGERSFLQWKKRTSALFYNFEQDLKKLKDDWHSNFTVRNGQHPFLLEIYLQRKITPETFSILCDISKTLPLWREEIREKIVSSDIIFKAEKYLPFIEFDRKKFVQAVRKRHEL